MHIRHKQKFSLDYSTFHQKKIPLGIVASQIPININAQIATQTMLFSMHKTFSTSGGSLTDKLCIDADETRRFTFRS